MEKELNSNTKVKVIEPSTDPPSKEFDFQKDIRINPRTKKQLITNFWKGKKDIVAKVAYVSSESSRVKLQKEGKVMVQIMDQCAQKILVAIPKRYLKAI